MTWAALQNPAVAHLYAQPWRHYHTLTHVLDLRGLIAWDKAEDREALGLAVLCHDAIYVPGSRDNERASGMLALSFGLPYGAEADRLIRLTQWHSPQPGDTDGVLLCNADLWGLGGSQSTYTANGQAIYLEVRAYLQASGDRWSDELWRQGRSKWLNSMLCREWIYRGDTEEIYRREAQARRNMANELEGLEAQLR